MQAAKNAAASAKETAANVAASAKSGLDKTKATVQEKVERMTAHDPMQKDMATQRKEEKIHQADYKKQEAREHNAAARQAAAAPGGTQSYTASGGGMGMQNYSTTGHGAGHQHHHRTGNMTEIMGGSEYPLGANTGTGTNPGIQTDRANTTATGLNPRSTDAVYPSDADIIGTGLNPMRNNNAGVGGGGGAPNSGYSTGGTYG